MPKIFISYRREDSPYEAVSVRDRLASHFGEGNVFFDLDSIRFGHNFRLKIGEKVGQCDYLIAVIGKSWLTVRDKQGQRRLDNPDDWVRLEIQAALSRNIPVIAVLLHNVRMPERDELPAGLEEMADRQAIPIRPLADFRHDIDRLIRDIDYQEKERLDAATDAAAEAEREAPVVRRQTESQTIEREKRERESAAEAEEERRQSDERVREAALKTQVQSDRSVGLSRSDPVTLPVTLRTLQYARLGGAGLGLLVFLIDRLCHKPDDSFLVPLLFLRDTDIQTVAGLLILPAVFAWAVGLIVCSPRARTLIPALALVGFVIGQYQGFKEMVPFAFACYGILLGNLTCEIARSHSRWAGQIGRLWMRLRKLPP